MPPTHQVLNQPPPLVDYDLFTTDPFLAGALEGSGASASDAELTEFGTLAGSAKVFGWGFEANRFPPACVPTTHTGTG